MPSIVLAEKKWVDFIHVTFVFLIATERQRTKSSAKMIPPYVDDNFVTCGAFSVS